MNPDKFDNSLFYQGLQKIDIFGCSSDFSEEDATITSKFQFIQHFGS